MTKGIGAAVVAVQEIARWSGGWPIKEQHMTNTEQAGLLELADRIERVAMLKAKSIVPNGCSHPIDRNHLAVTANLFTVAASLRAAIPRSNP